MVLYLLIYGFRNFRPSSVLVKSCIVEGEAWVETAVVASSFEEGKVACRQEFRRDGTIVVAVGVSWVIKIRHGASLIGLATELRILSLH